MLGRRRSAAKRLSVCSLSTLSGPDTAKVIVGVDRKEVFIPRKLLATCQFFRDRIDDARLEFANGQAHLVICLEDQCPDMFELFTFWLYERRGFARFIDDAEIDDRCRDVSWDFVNLHLFAAQINQPALQDLAMDAIQDLFLRCNWDIDPKLIDYVYTECDADTSCRLRKWIVAMTAWTLSGLETKRLGEQIRKLFDASPEFRNEYEVHLRKMAKSRLEVRFKNPQLRLPSNNLRTEERQFGFRQCTFHTHRSSVGQGKCPHMLVMSPSVMSPLTDGYVDSDSDRGESRFGSRMVSPSSDVIRESDEEGI
ncbi:hypothetical protein F4778DRAFT_365416 [Xylariomycetidae sp. FL2044]|nr:hypothetical protein F4778DRAFT_365416 [Xylariomycetidae sp. FL2044]